MALDRLSEVFAVVEKWAPRGETVLDTENKLICPVPDVAPEAWLHVLFAPASSSQISRAETEGDWFPPEFHDFLPGVNGISLFSGHVDVWGIRTTHVRAGDAPRQPFDILSLNRPGQRPLGSPTRSFFSPVPHAEGGGCFFRDVAEWVSCWQDRQQEGLLAH